MTWFLRPVREQSGLMRREEDPILSLHREINRAFGDLLGGVALRETSSCLLSPRVDLKEDEKAFYVTSDMPGLTENDIELSFEDGTLTLRGEKKVERDEKGETWHLIERSCGNFARQLVLPTQIQADKIEARVEKGVLSITLPKQAPEEAKTTKIQIKSA